MNQPDDISRLFEAERREQPPREAAARGWRELAISLEANIAGLPVARGPLRFGLSLAAKWSVGSGLAALALTAGSIGLTRSPAAHARPTSAVVVASSAAASANFERQPSRAQISEPELSASAASVSKPASGASSRPSTFKEELRLIELAKQEQDAGHHGLAQGWLDRHEHEYPNGVFSSERDAMRVLLGCQSATEDGRQRARQFMQRNPGSPLLDRISRACWPAREPAPVGSNSFPNFENDK